MSTQQQVNEQQIYDSLRNCMDPEVPINIVDMGLIYNVDVKENNDVNIRMTMTTKGCPLHDTIVEDVKRYTKKVQGVNNVDVEITYDPPWSTDMMSEEAKKKLGIGKDKQNVAPIDYDKATPQGVGKLAQQQDGSLALVNEHDQGFMVNEAIVDFWKSCNGERKVSELVDDFASKTGLQRSQVEKEVLQLLQQLQDGGLVVIPQEIKQEQQPASGEEVPNVDFKPNQSQ